MAACSTTGGLSARIIVDCGRCGTRTPNRPAAIRRTGWPIRIVHLEPGDYTAYFVTDSSHSSVKWNASAPPDGGRWGMTLLAATGKLEPSAVTTHAEVADPSIIAQLVRVRDNERPTTSFTLARDSAVRIYALGEGRRQRNGRLRMDRRPRPVAEYGK